MTEKYAILLFYSVRYSLMSSCWKENPEERPTFDQLTTTLENMMTKDCPYFDFNKFKEASA